MERERDVLVSPTVEVPVIEGEVVTAIRTLADRGVGEKTIAREVGVARNVVQRLLVERGVRVGVRTLGARRRGHLTGAPGRVAGDGAGRNVVGWRDGIAAALTHFRWGPAHAARGQRPAVGLNDAAGTEQTYLDFLDGVLRQEVDSTNTGLGGTSSVGRGSVSPVA